jgi:HK97 family phage prohead protease
MEKEYRLLRHSELRATGDLRVSGYSAVFNVPSLPIGPQKYREYIRPGAFTRSLDGDVVGLYDHNPANVLGRTAAGTMKLSQDSIGLKTEINLPPTQLGRDTYELVKRRDLNGMSIGFSITQDRWDATHTTRELLEVDLAECSIVSFPAYPQTSIEARSLGRPAASDVLIYSGIREAPVSESERERLRLRVALLRRL